MSATVDISDDAVELHNINTQQSNEPEHTTSEPGNTTEGAQPLTESSLAPVDRGFGAWSFVWTPLFYYLRLLIAVCQLADAFFIEGLVWGFPNAYGVFLLKYMEDAQWSSRKHASVILPLIGPAASGIMYCAGAD